MRERGRWTPAGYVGTRTWILRQQFSGLRPGFRPSVLHRYVMRSYAARATFSSRPVIDWSLCHPGPACGTLRTHFSYADFGPSRKPIPFAPRWQPVDPPEFRSTFSIIALTIRAGSPFGTRSGSDRSARSAPPGVPMYASNPISRRRYFHDRLGWRATGPGQQRRGARFARHAVAKDWHYR